MLNLGIVGLSPGNGHPYSWSSICNGFDPQKMEDCPFPTIPRYLSQHNFPDEFLQDVRVTAIWCQQRSVAEHVARAACIERVVDRLEDLQEGVDGILLARDDSENHARFALPFLEAGFPLFIDKPMANRITDAEALLDAQLHDAQIHTCSAFRYIPEVFTNFADLDRIGHVHRVEAEIGKAWPTYSIHGLEPAVRLLDANSLPRNTQVVCDGKAVTLSAFWRDERSLRVTTRGTSEPTKFRIYGEHRKLNVQITDPFAYFKAGLEAFVNQIRTGILQIPRKQTLTAIGLVERGMQELP